MPTLRLRPRDGEGERVKELALPQTSLRRPRRALALADLGGARAAPSRVADGARRRPRRRRHAVGGGQPRRVHQGVRQRACAHTRPTGGRWSAEAVHIRARGRSRKYAHKVQSSRSYERGVVSTSCPAFGSPCELHEISGKIVFMPGFVCHLLVALGMKIVQEQP